MTSVCPSDTCGSTNVRHLPLYWESLPGDSSAKGAYKPPAAADSRPRLLAVLAAVAGIVLAVTGAVGLGLLLAAGGAVGALIAHGRVTAAERERAAWERGRICLACTERWEA